MNAKEKANAGLWLLKQAVLELVKSRPGITPIEIRAELVLDSRNANGERKVAFLEVFLHEATTPPSTGPATEALHFIGVEYGDIPQFAWAYEQDVPRTGFALGHPAEEAPPLPWPDRETALGRNKELQRTSEQVRRYARGSNAS